MSKAEKITPFKDGRRRRMKWTELSAVALLPGGKGKRGANPEANMVYVKSKDKGMSKETFKGTFKALDVPVEIPFAEIPKEIKAKYEGPGLRAFKIADMLTDVVNGHQHALTVSIYDGKVDVWLTHATSEGSDNGHTHPVGLNQLGEYEIGYSEGHTHALDNTALSALILNALSCKLAELGVEKINGERTSEKEDDMSDSKNDNEDVTRHMSPEQVSHFEALTGKAKQAFAEADWTGRQEKVDEAAAKAEAAKAADPVQKQLDEARTEIADMKLDRQVDAFSAVPMERATLKSTVKALNTIEDEAEREAAFKALQSLADAGDAAKKTLSTSEGASALDGAASKAEAESKADALAKELSKAEGITVSKARARIWKENPDLALAASQ